MSEIRRDVAYKLLPVEDWTETCAQGAVAASAADRADGYIHLSTAAQLPGTLAKHYREASQLILAELDLAVLGEAVRWEPARDGALFPHVYGRAGLEALTRVWALGRAPDGAWRLPDALGSAP